MSNRIDILFGSSVDSSGAEKDISQIKKAFNKSQIEIKPIVDDSSIKQLEKNLKIVEDKAKNIKIGSSSFTQDDVAYNISQKAYGSSYKTPSIDIDYEKTYSILERKLRKLYITAREEQELYNDSIKKGSTTFSSSYAEALSKIQKEIEVTRSKMSSLGFNEESPTVSRLSEQLNMSKLEQESIQEGKALSNLDQLLEEVSSKEEKLAKARGSGASDETISSLGKEVALYKELIEEITSASTATDKVKETAKIGLEKSSLNAESVYQTTKSKAEEEVSLSDYRKQLSLLSQAQTEMYQLQQEIKSGRTKDTQEAQSYLKILQEQESSSKNQLDTMDKNLSGTKAGTKAAQLRKEAEDEVNKKIAEQNFKLSQQLPISERIKNSFKSLADNFIDFGLAQQAMQLLQRAVTSSISEIKELNAAMTDVQMVTGDTAQQTQDLADKYSDMAEQLGATTVEVANGASEWLRQGKSVEDTNTLLNASMMMSKVGAIESSKATELLTSTLNGYKMGASEAMHVVDAMSKVDLSAATSVEELATALQSTANMARVNGVSFENLIGMVGAVSEATRRSASVVGNSFKTIFSRLTNVAAGKNTDENGESLNDVETVLKKNGIALRQTNGEWRNMYDVISEVASKWKDLTSVERDQVSTAVAGTRQREIWLSLMENWTRAQELATGAMNSDGTTAEKFDKYLESIEAHTKQLKASWDKLIYSQGAINAINFFIDSGKTIIKILDVLLNTTGGRTVSILTAVYIVFNKVSKAMEVAKDATTEMESIGLLSKLFRQLATSAAASGSTISASMTTGAFATEILSGAVQSLWASIAASPLLPIAALVAALAGAIAIYNAATTSVEEYNKQLEENKTKLEELNSEKSSIEELSNTRELTELESKRLEIINAQIALLEKRNKTAERGKYIEESKNRKKGVYAEGVTAVGEDDYQNQVTQHGVKTYGAATLQKDVDRYNSLYSEISSLNPTNEKDLSRYNELDKEITNLQTHFVDLYQSLMEAKDGGQQLTDSDQELYNIVSNLVDKQDLLKTVTNEVADTSDEAAEDTSTLTQEVTKLTDKYKNYSELINQIKEDQESYGTVSIDTLNSIIEKYPTLQQNVEEYLMGMQSEQDLMNAMQSAYQLDADTQIQAILTKMKAQENYYNTLGEFDKTVVNSFLADYGVDLKNHESYAQAKLQIEQALLGKLITAWGQYYNAQTQSFDLNAMWEDKNVPMADIIAANKAVKANAQAVQLLNQAYDSAMGSTIQAKFKKLSSAIDKASDSSKSASSAASDQEKAYKDLLEMTVNMLKKKKELEKDALKEQLEGYKKVIDAQKTILEQQDDEYKHQEELQEKNKSVSTLENQIAELQFDTSAEGVAKRLELEDQLNEKKKDLADFQHDYSVDQQKDALDKEQSRYEEFINNQIDQIDKYLSNTGNIQAEAIRLINEHSQALFNDLIQYNRTYGDSLDSTVIAAWNGATTAVNQYTSALNEAAAASSRLSGSGGTSSTPSSGITATGAVQYAVISTDGKVRSIFNAVGSAVNYAEKNSDRGYKVVKVSSGSYSIGDTYSTGKSTTRPGLYSTLKKHHSGLDSGFVGGLKGNEEFVKALKGEAFVTKSQQDKFMKEVLPNIASSAVSYSGSKFDNLLNINVSGNLDEDVVPKIQKVAQEMFSKLNSTMFQGGYKRNTSVVPF